MIADITLHLAILSPIKSYLTKPLAGFVGLILPLIERYIMNKLKPKHDWVLYACIAVLSYGFYGALTTWLDTGMI
jgi:hypothetical protein